jgi:hypothetical protein
MMTAYNYFLIKQEVTAFYLNLKKIHRLEKRFYFNFSCSERISFCSKQQENIH